jgi:cell division protease FtsH
MSGHEHTADSSEPPGHSGCLGGMNTLTLPRSSTPLENYQRDFAQILTAAAELGGYQEPIAFEPSYFGYHMKRAAIPEAPQALGEALIRNWVGRRQNAMHIGLRLFHLGEHSFVQVVSQTHDNQLNSTFDFYITDRTHYRSLYRLAHQLYDESIPPGPPPVLEPETFEALRRNTLDYLSSHNLKRIKELGGRPKRGLILTGPPGNGKTSACRWVREGCSRLGLEHKIVSPDDYQAARRSCNPSAAVKQLFKVDGSGVIFFDDMDLALRDRSQSASPEDQAVFLGAMDGMEVNEGVVYIFTSNLALELIDPAFRRPGRIDVVLQLRLPTYEQRGQLFDRWNPELRAGIDRERVLKDSQGMSFAELDEHKNLLVLRYIETQTWDWTWAKAEFERCREELAIRKPIGFASMI